MIRVATSLLYRQLEALALHDFRIVHPEEIAVQYGLYDACHYSEWIEITFTEISVYPVRNVQSPVDT